MRMVASAGGAGAPEGRITHGRTVRAYNPIPLPTGSASVTAAHRARRTPHEARPLAVRLQLKLGAVTEQDRLADSPDTVVVVEPAVGSVGRTKGNLYLLVTSRTTGSRAREATRIVADTIRNEYYYDESAGIRQCLIKVMGVANKRLAHQRDRYGLGHARRGGPDRRRGRRRPRPRAVRRDRRPGRGLPHPPGPPVDAARPQPRARPAGRGPRARGLARRAQRRRLAVPRVRERRRQGRDGRPQGRARHAPSAVGDRAPPRAVRRGRRLGQRRRARVRGERGRRDAQGQDAGPGPARRAAGRRCPTARRSRSPTP